MRKGSLVDSENEYEAGHVMSYTNHSRSDNKDPGNSAQFYMGRHCSHAPHEALFCLF